MNSTQDWFMMTGDLIINLRSTKTGDSFKLNSQTNDPFRLRKRSSLKTESTKQLALAASESKVEAISVVNEDGGGGDGGTSSEHLNQSEQPSSEPQTNGHHEFEQHETDVEKQLPEVEATNLSPSGVVVDTGAKGTLASSATSNSSSGNSSGIAEEEFTNSQGYSDTTSLSSPSKLYNNMPSNDVHYTDDYGYYYEHYEDKIGENCYENIGECDYLGRSHDSNLYNLVEESKSFDNISLDSECASQGGSGSGGSGSQCYSTKQQCIDVPSVNRLARRLYNLEGFQKCDVTRHLCKNNGYSRAVAEEYLRLFDFTGQTLDEALRCFLSRFYLTGETQERERVLVYFSKRFHECNSESNFLSVDSIHTLTCALMLLNTDLHEENILRKMTCSDFIMNLSGMNDGGDYPSELLKYLYYSIKNNPLGRNEEDGSEVSSNRKDRNVFAKITTISRSIGSPYATLPRKHSNTTNSSNPFVELPNPTFAIEYKKGYIRRKCCYDSNGKRTPLGRRGWKMFYATLRDLVLYLHKDEHGFRKSQLEESFANSIRIHHSIASVANDYPKKKFVFRLITADYAEFLFETSDSRELQSWVDTLNTTAASLSAPALPMAVSSDNYKFKREIFPVSHTKLSLRDQLIDQENKLLSLQMELELLLEKSGRTSSSNKVYHKDFAEKENYLQHEVKRYRVYISCLKWKLKQHNEQQHSTLHEQPSSPLHGSSSGHRSTGVSICDAESNYSV